MFIPVVLSPEQPIQFNVCQTSVPGWPFQIWCHWDGVARAIASGAKQVQGHPGTVRCRGSPLLGNMETCFQGWRSYEVMVWYGVICDIYVCNGVVFAGFEVWSYLKICLMFQAMGHSQPRDRYGLMGFSENGALYRKITSIKEIDVLYNI